MVFVLNIYVMIYLNSKFRKEMKKKATEQIRLV